MLFAIDFDDTIASEHTHNKIQGVVNNEKTTMGHSETKENPEKQWNLIKDIKPIGDYDAGPPIKSAWADNIKTMIDQGHKVAIVSFNSYGHLIPDYMEKVVGLPKEYVDKIEVVAFMPNNPPKGSGIPAVETEKADKNNHIRLAEKKLGFQESDHAIVLIDDSEKNIREAEKPKQEDIGFSTILADSEGTHLNKISTVLKESKEYQDQAKLEREQLEKEKLKEEKAAQTEDNKLPQKTEQQTAAIGIPLASEQDKQKFIARFEAEAAKLDMLVTKDIDRIIVSEKYLNKHNQIEPRPLCYYDTQRSEVKMMHSNNNISDYTKVFKLVANAVKSLFSKIKAFFCPNKAEKDKMKEAARGEDSTKNLESRIGTDYSYYEEQRKSSTYSSSPHLYSSQQRIDYLEKKLASAYEKKFEDYFNKTVPPSLHGKLNQFKKNWINQLKTKTPPNSPNETEILSKQEKKNEAMYKEYKKEVSTVVKTAIKEEGKNFEHRPNNPTPKEKHEQTMQLLKENHDEQIKALEKKGPIDDHASRLADLNDNHQSKLQTAHDLYQIEEKAQGKYPQDNKLYDQVSDLSTHLANLNSVSVEDTHSPLFKIENEFQSNLEKLSEKYEKEGLTEEHPKEWYEKEFEKIHEERDTKLTNLKSETESKIDVIEEKNEMKNEQAKKEEEEKLDSTSSGPQLNQ